MITKWLYCFQCYMSHLFTQDERGDWICPNCGFVRAGWEVKVVEIAEAENETPE